MQVYLQASQGDAQTWNAQFSSMMVKMLQDTYKASPLHKTNLARSDVLAQEAAPRVGPPKAILLLMSHACGCCVCCASPHLPCPALPCLALPCHALPCPALPCHALPLLALPCLAFTLLVTAVELVSL